MREIIVSDLKFKDLEASPRVKADDPNIIEVVWILRNPHGSGFLKHSACYVRRFPWFTTKLRLMTFDEKGFPVVAVKK